MVRQIRKRSIRKKIVSTKQPSHADGTHIVHCILSLVIVVIIVGGLTLMAGTPSKNLIEHNPNINPRYPSILRQARPEVVLLGNSMMGEGVDDQLFMNKTRLRTIKLWGGGWSSAMWYLAMKNVIAPANPRPKTVVLFFRDHFLTYPTYRVTGEYKKWVDQLTGPEEPLLERLAYLNAMDPLTYQLNQNWSLFQKREHLKESLESNVKSWVGSIYGHPDTESVNQSIHHIFGVDNLLAEELGNAQLKSEEVKDKNLYDFQKSLPVSFLPEMVRIARDSNIQLALVRVKRRREAEGRSKPAGLDEYIRDLKRWCSEQQVPLIDFSNEPQLTLDLYADGDHLNRSDGQTLFTQLLVEQLKPYLGSATASR